MCALWRHFEFSFLPDNQIKIFFTFLFKCLVDMFYWSYADDTQILSPNDYGPKQPINLSLQWEIKQLDAKKNLFQLNKDMAEIIVFGSNEARLALGTYFDSRALKTYTYVKVCHNHWWGFIKSCNKIIILAS